MRGNKHTQNPKETADERNDHTDHSIARPAAQGRDGTVAHRVHPSFAALLPRWRLPFTWPQIESVVKSIKESDKESTKEVNPDLIAAILAASVTD